MDTWRREARATWNEVRGWPAALLAAWLLTMLSMPILNLIWGAPALTLSISLNVLLQAILALLLLVRGQGVRRTALAAAVIFVLAWALEAVGSATGLPFGAYHYTDRLQPQLAHVPLLIPLAWTMMLPPAWAVARRLSGRRSGVAFVALSALAFTAWDLYLDPQMVEWELWVWDQPGGYFGIPYLNFAGWVLGAALITAAARPAALPERSLLLVYTLTWLLEAVALTVFWDLPGPAACGFVAMGIFVVLACRSVLKEAR